MALVHLQRGNIAPVDLAQAAIGPGMAVYTRYAKVLDAYGEPVPVRDALVLINQTLDEVLAEQEGDFDTDTRWAVAWFVQFGFDSTAITALPRHSPRRRTPVSLAWWKREFWRRKSGNVRLYRNQRNCPKTGIPPRTRRLTAWETVHHLVRICWNQTAKALRPSWPPRLAPQPRPLASCATASTHFANAANARPRHCRTTPWCRAGRKSFAWHEKSKNPEAEQAALFAGEES